jgi:hypothetical protein
VLEELGSSDAIQEGKEDCDISILKLTDISNLKTDISNLKLTFLLHAQEEKASQHSDANVHVLLPLSYPDSQHHWPLPIASPLTSLRQRRIHILAVRLLASTATISLVMASASRSCRPGSCQQQVRVGGCLPGIGMRLPRWHPARHWQISGNQSGIAVGAALPARGREGPGTRPGGAAGRGFNLKSEASLSFQYLK